MERKEGRWKGGRKNTAQMGCWPQRNSNPFGAPAGLLPFLHLGWLLGKFQALLGSIEKNVDRSLNLQAIP